MLGPCSPDSRAYKNTFSCLYASCKEAQESFLKSLRTSFREEFALNIENAPIQISVVYNGIAYHISDLL